MIVLDTNVLSELMRPEPAPAVLAWMANREASALFTTSATQAEILYGVALLPPGKRRDALEGAIRAVFEIDLAGRVLPFDADAARAYARIAVGRRLLGRPISQLDCQIAAVVASREAAIATRNVADFEGCGFPVIDPWARP